MNDPATLWQIAQQFGTPCFVYDLDIVRRQIAAIRAAFGNRFRISYAMKCNPNRTLLTRLRTLVDLLDVSSGGEVRRALNAGWPAELLSFTGPGKSDPELELAIQSGVGDIVLESPHEARRVAAISQRAHRPQSVLIRANPTTVPPGFGSGMSGRPSQFGIDEEELDDAIAAISSLSAIRLRGFHAYAGTQCLNASAIAQAYARYVELFQRICQTHDLRPARLVFGSGMGIPYYPGDEPLELARIGHAINPLLDSLQKDPRYGDTSFILETGRFIVGESGTYLTRIISSKRSRGTEIRICDGGMNHHLAACGHLGSVIPRNHRMFKIGPPSASQTKEPVAVDLYGPLCTSIDRLAHNITVPDPKIGDLIAIESSGAYGLTSSPVGFISHELPREVLVEKSGGELRSYEIGGND